MQAKVIKKSQNKKTGDIITTFQLEYPRIVHGEVLTHKLFSRNTSSSRAVPVNTMLSKIEENPYFPKWWGANKKGMQASKEINDVTSARLLWDRALNISVDVSRHLKDLGVHKQHTNRLTEPFQNIQVVLTTTCLDNFFNLRDNEEAQPEIQELAQAMKEVYYGCKAEVLEPGQWHLPYLNSDDLLLSIEEQTLISAARCARVSYFLRDGKTRDIEKDFELAKRLIISGHWSPFEHPACASPEKVMIANFVGWMQARKFYPSESGGQIDNIRILNSHQAREMMFDHGF